jgi:hypothetical protein
MKACAAGYALTYVTTPAVSQLKRRMPDCRQVEVPYTSDAWLLHVQYHVHLDLHGLVLLLHVSYII